jgi:hypothetical protein
VAGTIPSVSSGGDEHYPVLSARRDFGHLVLSLERKLRPEPAAGVGRSHQEDAPAQPRQGSFVPVRMLGGLNFGGQMTMTAELSGGTRLLIPVADRCAKYTKAGHPRVRVPEADLDKQPGVGPSRQNHATGTKARPGSSG